MISSENFLNYDVRVRNFYAYVSFSAIANVADYKYCVKLYGNKNEISCFVFLSLRHLCCIHTSIGSFSCIEITYMWTKIYYNYRQGLFYVQGSSAYVCIKMFSTCDVSFDRYMSTTRSVSLILVLPSLLFILYLSCLSDWLMQNVKEGSKNWDSVLHALGKLYWMFLWAIYFLYVNGPLCIDVLINIFSFRASCLEPNF